MNAESKPQTRVTPPMSQHYETFPHHSNTITRGVRSINICANHNCTIESQSLTEENDMCSIDSNTCGSTSTSSCSHIYSHSSHSTTSSSSNEWDSSRSTCSLGSLDLMLQETEEEDMSMDLACPGQNLDLQSDSNSDLDPEKAPIKVAQAQEAQSLVETDISKDPDPLLFDNEDTLDRPDLLGLSLSLTMDRNSYHSTVSKFSKSKEPVPQLPQEAIQDPTWLDHDIEEDDNNNNTIINYPGEKDLLVSEQSRGQSQQQGLSSACSVVKKKLNNNTNEASLLDPSFSYPVHNTVSGNDICTTNTNTTTSDKLEPTHTLTASSMSFDLAFDSQDQDEYNVPLHPMMNAYAHMPHSSIGLSYGLSLDSSSVSCSGATGDPNIVDTGRIGSSLSVLQVAPAPAASKSKSNLIPRSESSMGDPNSVSHPSVLDSSSSVGGTSVGAFLSLSTLSDSPCGLIPCRRSVHVPGSIYLHNDIAEENTITDRNKDDNKGKEITPMDETNELELRTKEKGSGTNINHPYDEQEEENEEEEEELRKHGAYLPRNLRTPPRMVRRSLYFPSSCTSSVTSSLTSSSSSSGSGNSMEQVTPMDYHDHADCARNQDLTPPFLPLGGDVASTRSTPLLPRTHKTQSDLDQNMGRRKESRSFSTPVSPVGLRLRDDDDLTVSTEVTECTSNVSRSKPTSVSASMSMPHKKDECDVLLATAGVSLGDCVFSIMDCPGRKQRKKWKLGRIARLHEKIRNRRNVWRVLRRVGVGSSHANTNAHRLSHNQNELLNSPWFRVNSSYSIKANIRGEVGENHGHGWTTALSRDRVRAMVGVTTWGMRTVHDAMWRMRLLRREAMRLDRRRATKMQSGSRSSSHREEEDHVSPVHRVGRNHAFVTSQSHWSPLSKIQMLRPLIEDGTVATSSTMTPSPTTSLVSAGSRFRRRGRQGYRMKYPDRGRSRERKPREDTESELKLKLDHGVSMEKSGTRFRVMEDLALDHMKRDELSDALEVFQQMWHECRIYYDGLGSERRESKFGWETIMGTLLHHIGTVHLLSARYEKAADYFAKAVQVRRKYHKKDNRYSNRVASLSMLGIANYAQENFILAQKALREASIILRSYPPSSSLSLQMAELLNNQACIQYEIGQKTSALKLFKEAADQLSAALVEGVYTKRNGPVKCSMAKLAITKSNMGYLYLKLKHLDAAIMAFEEALLHRHFFLHENDSFVLATMDHLALANLQKGNKEKTTKIYGQMLRMQIETYGSHHIDCLQTLEKISMLSAEAKKVEGGTTLLRSRKKQMLQGAAKDVRQHERLNKLMRVCKVNTYSF